MEKKQSSQLLQVAARKPEAWRYSNTLSVWSNKDVIAWYSTLCFVASPYHVIPFIEHCFELAEVPYALFVEQVVRNLPQRQKYSPKFELKSSLTT